MATLLLSPLSFSPPISDRSLTFSFQKISLFNLSLSFKRAIKPQLQSSLLSSRGGISSSQKRLRPASSTNVSSIPSKTRDYEFYDAETEVEVRIDITGLDIESSNDIFVDTDDTSLLIRAKSSGRLITLMEVSCLFDKIKSSDTIWFVQFSENKYINEQPLHSLTFLHSFHLGYYNRYLDDDQMVINLKKYDVELKWPDVMESWESLARGLTQLLKGTSIYIVGENTEINQKVGRELAVGLGYTPLDTSELLESFTQQSIDSWVSSEGADSVAEAEATVLEGVSSHVRTVVATLGEQCGASSRHDKWRHLHAGFSVWLSKSEAADEASAKEEARRHIQEGSLAYGNADVVVKLGGWDLEHSKAVAQACLSALKRLILSDKQLTGKKSLYIRLGCRGDWPNIKPPGWDPSREQHPSA